MFVLGAGDKIFELYDLLLGRNFRGQIAAVLQDLISHLQVVRDKAIVIQGQWSVFPFFRIQIPFFHSFEDLSFSNAGKCIHFSVLLTDTGITKNRKSRVRSIHVESLSRDREFKVLLHLRLVHAPDFNHNYVALCGIDHRNTDIVHIINRMTADCEQDVFFFQSSFSCLAVGTQAGDLQMGRILQPYRLQNNTEPGLRGQDAGGVP